MSQAWSTSSSTVVTPFRPIFSRWRENLPARLHSLDARCQSLATVLHEVEDEEPLEIFGPLQNLVVP
jgi:hypothetical protein